ncbi:MAG: PPC domain-containing protein, partial [Planctomycetaceae bacterium]
MKLLTPTAALFIVLVHTQLLSAQTGYPMLMATKPVAAAVGGTSEHTVFARYSLDDAYQVLVSGEGVTGEIIPEEQKPEDEKAKEKEKDAKAKGEKKRGRRANAETLKVRFTVASDAKPGVRDYRIATPRGVSTVGQLVIGRDPVINEADKNNTAAEAQSITLPATVCGVIEAIEDVDIYKFKVEAGKSFAFHVRGLRLCDRIHDLQEHLDPIITLRNASGATLATADNEFAGDPFLSYRFHEAGEYLLEVRDVRYKGNQYPNYSVEISDRPFVIVAFPLAAARGADTRLEQIGAQM